MISIHFNTISDNFLGGNGFGEAEMDLILKCCLCLRVGDIKDVGWKDRCLMKKINAKFSMILIRTLPGGDFPG